MRSVVGGTRWSQKIEPDPDLVGDAPAAATSQGLADRAELALIAFERTRMPMVMTNPRQSDNPIVLANAAFLDLTGYAADEVLGQNCRFLQGDETSAEAVARLRGAVHGGRHVELELLNYRKDGSTFWNKLALTPVHDSGGRLVYFFGSQIDTTRRRRAEELEAEQHALLMEVDHRANNVLALVEGLVRVSRTDSANRYAAAVERRIQALARVHALLAQEQWKGASLEELLKRQIEPYGANHVGMEGAPLVIRPQMAQPLSVVIHELAANAAIHGSLSRPEGHLAIHWRSDNGRDLHLAWQETLGPAPSDVRAAGSGTIIVQGVLERQLGGSLRNDWRRDGLGIELRIPDVVGAA